MQINGILISEDDFLEYLQIILSVCVEKEIVATEFELTFILAAVYFSKHNCDAVVLEVGLGGDLDATNVVKTCLSIICSVSLDHTRLLGSTVEQIARRKAGILKPNTPAIIGPHCPQNIFREIASDIGTPLYTLDGMLKEIVRATDSTTTTIAPLCQLSSHDKSDTEIVDTDSLNKKLAFAALYLLETCVGGIFSSLNIISNVDILSALSLRPPCRWDSFVVPITVFGRPEPSNVQVILDVGHNPAAVAALSRRIKYDLSDRSIW